MDCVMKQSIHKNSLIYRRGGADTGHNIDQSFSPLQLKRFCQDPTIQDAVHKQTQLDFHHQMGSTTHCKN